MEVVLLEKVERLGQMGELVKVKPGYARNYLLPYRKAMRATKENLKRFREQKILLEAANLKRRGEAEAIASKMSDLSLFVIRQAGENNHLYGSVAARDIADVVSAAGFIIQRSQVKLRQPIKTLGTSSVLISLHPEVTVAVNVNVVRSSEEITSDSLPVIEPVAEESSLMGGLDSQEEAS